MREDKTLIVGTEEEKKNNDPPKNKHLQDKELFKYKKSLFIIKKSIHLLRNHYYNKICNMDSDRKRKQTKLIYLKKKNVLLEDKCSFYSEHVEELNRLYSKQLENQETINFHSTINTTNDNTNHEDPSSNTNILKLREEQIERLTEQLNIVNNLYLKQVDNNKRFLRELDEANKNIHYQNNKIQEQKIYIHILKRELKFCKKHNKSKKNLNVNLDKVKIVENEPFEKESDVCLSVLCFLKSELEIIDEENRKRRIMKEKNKSKDHRSHDFLLQFADDPFFKFRKIKLFDEIKKKNIFSYYKESLQKKGGTNEELKKMPSLSKSYKRKIHNKYRLKYYEKRDSFVNIEKKKVQKVKEEYKNIQLNKWDSLSSNNANTIEKNESFDEPKNKNHNINKSRSSSSSSSHYIDCNTKYKIDPNENVILKRNEDYFNKRRMKVKKKEKLKKTEE